MRFEFATATRIVFGPGAFREIGPLLAEMLPGERPTRVLVVTGRTPEDTEPLRNQLEDAGLKSIAFAVAGEPTIEMVQTGTQLAREENCAAVIGFGGGSALDTGKAIAALLTNPGDLLDYLEVVGRNRPLLHPPVPCIAVPTTAGTGAEVTRNAVLASTAHKVKVSLRSPLMLPRLALIDPELTLGLPPAATATTGMDALTQLIEAFVSLKANPLTDGLCREGISRVGRSLLRAYRDGRDLAARTDMCIASLFSGLALANAGLGAVHGFAAPLGGMFSAPHGAVCAALLPEAMEINTRALREREPDNPASARYAEVGRLLTGAPAADAEQAIQWVHRLREELAIPTLRNHGVTEADLPILVEKGQQASSMKGNPIALTPDELREILRRAM
ncbi:MAG: iron-containing alcohol dehydrogenase [Phycisphaerales bacterium]|nr:iron-containing alcohol dehydrogenase [Phycisphaerales bacterium]